MPPWSAERSARAIRVLWPAGFVLGVVAERAAFAWSDVGRWVPDLVTGWALIACGLLAWRRRAESRSGALMTAAGFAWFAGNFTSAAVYLHRGPLVQLVLTYPDGRLRGRAQPVAVGIGYATAVVAPVWRNQTATLVLAALLVIVAAHDYLGAVGRDRRAKQYALEATIFMALLLAGTAIVRLATPTPTATNATLLAYDAALCALAVGLFVRLIREPWARTNVTDLVVELGERREDSLRAALARALGDTTLEVAYRLPDSGGYVDAAGQPVVLSTSGSTRRVTYVERDGQIVAALVHDPGILEDAELSEAVAAAARLGATNARLQAEVRSQVTELQASRRRLLLAADDERRRLEERLRQGAERRLSTVAPVLANADARAITDRDTAARLQRAREQLRRTIDELRELAAGLHPRELAAGGFASALASLSERAPVPVELSVTGERLPTDLQRASYFICSEALANVAKYSGASCASITVSAVDGHLRVEVADDGVGGADATRGSGLRGLADRVHALGGTFSVASPMGVGTRLLAEFPLDERTP